MVPDSLQLQDPDHLDNCNNRPIEFAKRNFRIAQTASRFVISFLVLNVSLISTGTFLCNQRLFPNMMSVVSNLWVSFKSCNRVFFCRLVCSRAFHVAKSPRNEVFDYSFKLKAFLCVRQFDYNILHHVEFRLLGNSKSVHHEIVTM